MCFKRSTLGLHVRLCDRLLMTLRLSTINSLSVLLLSIHECGSTLSSGSGFPSASRMRSRCAPMLPSSSPFDSARRPQAGLPDNLDLPFGEHAELYCALRCIVLESLAGSMPHCANDVNTRSCKVTWGLKVSRGSILLPLARISSSSSRVIRWNSAKLCIASRPSCTRSTAA